MLHFRTVWIGRPVRQGCSFECECTSRHLAETQNWRACIQALNLNLFLSHERMQSNAFVSASSATCPDICLQFCFFFFRKMVHVLLLDTFDGCSPKWSFAPIYFTNRWQFISRVTVQFVSSFFSILLLFLTRSFRFKKMRRNRHETGKSREKKARAHTFRLRLTREYQMSTCPFLVMFRLHGFAWRHFFRSVICDFILDRRINGRCRCLLFFCRNEMNGALMFIAVFVYHFFYSSFLWIEQCVRNCVKAHRSMFQCSRLKLRTASNLLFVFFFLSEQKRRSTRQLMLFGGEIETTHNNNNFRWRIFQMQTKCPFIWKTICFG